MNDNFDAYLEGLVQFGHSLQKDLGLSQSMRSKSVKRVSDQFLFDINSSQWKQDWFQIGYLSYFMPVQVIRLAKVLERCFPSRVLPKGISKLVDFGCGPGSFGLAAKYHFHNPDFTLLNIDQSMEALDFAKSFLDFVALSNTSFIQNSKIPESCSSEELLVMSYTLCEGLDTSTIESYDHLLIIEPGQRQQSRDLIELRGRLISKGYEVLAPCTHQYQCPMSQRKGDWCHDQAEKPIKINGLRDLFPNPFLPFSYIFISKTLKADNKGLFRLIGNPIKEKGKHRIAACSGPDRTFLSWLTRSKLELNISRGDLLEVSESAEQKGNEIRVSETPKTRI